MRRPQRGGGARGGADGGSRGGVNDGDGWSSSVGKGIGEWGGVN